MKLPLLPLFFLPLLLTPSAAAQQLPEGSVVSMRCPGGGRQPQIRQGKDGVVHLLYFQGEDEGGDLFYVRSEDEGASFSEPLRVNQEQGSVDGGGNGVRGGELVVAKDGTVHVAWVGVAEKGKGAPAMYARLRPGLDTFETARRLSTRFGGLDASPTLALYHNRVLVYWHAPVPGATEKRGGQLPRRIYCAVSSDAGGTFADPAAVDEERFGVSAGCGIRAEVAKNGRISVMYREQKMPDRDYRILSTEDGGESYHTFLGDQQRIRKSPRTDVSSSLSVRGPMFAWGNFGGVWWTRIDKTSGKIVPPIGPRKKDVWRGRPVVLSTQRAVLLAWLEGSDRTHVDRIGWQGFDLRNRFPIGLGTIPDVPPGTHPALFVRPSTGGFTIVY